MVSDLFYIVFEENCKTRFIETLEVLLWDLKCIVSSSFKVTTKNILISLELVDLKLLQQDQ